MENAGYILALFITLLYAYSISLISKLRNTIADYEETNSAMEYQLREVRRRYEKALLEERQRNTKLEAKIKKISEFFSK
jgi:hypothetical protein